MILKPEREASLKRRKLPWVSLFPRQWHSLKCEMSRMQYIVHSTHISYTRIVSASPRCRQLNPAYDLETQYCAGPFGLLLKLTVLNWCNWICHLVGKRSCQAHLVSAYDSILVVLYNRILFTSFPVLIRSTFHSPILLFKEALPPRLLTWMLSYFSLSFYIVCSEMHYAVLFCCSTVDTPLQTDAFVIQFRGRLVKSELFSSRFLQNTWMKM